MIRLLGQGSPLRKKKGDVSLQFMLGVIIGSLFLVFLLIKGADLYAAITAEEATPLSEIVGILEEVSAGNPYDVVQENIHFGEDTALIGINPVSDRIGMYGDGDFHFTMSEPAYDYITTNFAKELFGDTTAAMVHFVRPDTCDKDKSCICWCESPHLVPVREGYYGSRDISDDDKERFYERYGSMKVLGFDVFSSSATKELQCSRYQCSPLDNVKFYPVMRNEFYSQYVADYDDDLMDATYHAAVASRESARQALLVAADFTNPAFLIIHIADTIRDVYFTEKNIPVPDFVYTNGFAVYRAPDSYKGFTRLGYPKVLPNLVPLSFGKLHDGSLAVCIDEGCFDVLNLAIIKDNVDTTTAAQMNRLVTGTGSTITGNSQRVKECEDVTDTDRFKVSEGTNKLLLKSIGSEISTSGKEDSEKTLNLITIMRERGEGLYSNQAIRVANEIDNQIVLELVAYCDDSKNTYKVLDTSIIGFPAGYSKQCNSGINTLVSPGQTIVFSRANLNGDIQPCISMR